MLRLGVMSNRALFVLWMLFIILQGLQYAAAITGPCEEELNRSQPDIEGASFQPRCTANGFYEEEQCNTTDCWCVDQCGGVVPGTYDDHDSIRCEEQPEPCLKEYMASLSSNPVPGEFRPRCRSDGFYYHTQCMETTCFCYDRCGHKVPGSDHPRSQVRDLVCDCPNDDHAYNCPTDPCEGAICHLHRYATCKPSICGGCKAEFYVDGNLVECVVESCTDPVSGTQFPIHAEFERDCQECYCTKWGEILCDDKVCPHLRAPHGCDYVTPPGGCCADRLYCPQPLRECLVDNLPVALCLDNPCVTTPCEAYPNALCVALFCGAKACTAVFYDKDLYSAGDYNDELDCSGNSDSGSKRVPGELQNQPTVFATTIPSSSPCPTITCANACGSSGRKVIFGCWTCECVDEPTTIPSCPPVTCYHFCGPSGLKIVNGCEICECVEEFVSTTTPPTTTSPPPTTIPSCQPVTCTHFCGPFGLKIVNGCEICECVEEFVSTTTPPTTTSPPPTTIPSCQPVTCTYFCGPSGLKIVNGCEICECVEEFVSTTTPPTTTSPPPTTIPSCQPVTCTHFCGPSGLKIVNGCEICECVEDFVSTTTPPTTTSPPPTTIPSSPCPLITCANACPLGRKVISGCRTCECIDGYPSTTSKPTTIPSECMDAEGQLHADGSSWRADPCMTCVCGNGDIKCIEKNCTVTPPYCEVDPVQNPEDCCSGFTCPQSCIDSFGNKRSINEVYSEGCQTCTCTPYGKPSCTPLPCPPRANNPPARCQYVKPPGGCCPTRLACMEPETDCVGPVVQCFKNECVDAVCEAYPEAKCSVSFCGLKACRAVFYDEKDQELDCKKHDIRDGDCFDESSGKTYKLADIFTNECNDCACMLGGVIVCTEKACGCVEESSGRFYKIGDSYNDECNQCTCKEDGFMCSTKVCKND